MSPTLTESPPVRVSSAAVAILVANSPKIFAISSSVTGGEGKYLSYVQYILFAKMYLLKQSYEFTMLAKYSLAEKSPNPISSRYSRVLKNEFLEIKNW